MTSEALRRVVVEYIKAVMQKRITFKNADERREGAERMIKEADQFKFLFRKLAAVSSHTTVSQQSTMNYCVEFTKLLKMCLVHSSTGGDDRPIEVGGCMFNLLLT